MYFIMTLVSVSFCPYLFCYFATSATDRISNIQQRVYDLNWYNFPPELRKHFILIMAQSQRTVHFDGLGLVHCTLECFGAVISIQFFLSVCVRFFDESFDGFSVLHLQLVRSAFSYYMAFEVISNRNWIAKKQYHEERQFAVHWFWLRSKQLFLWRTKLFSTVAN